MYESDKPLLLQTEVEKTKKAAKAITTRKPEYTQVELPSTYPLIKNRKPFFLGREESPNYVILF